jgi:hypothetical protein
MLKDVVSWLNYAIFDEIAVVLFGAVFLIVVWGVWKLRPDVADKFAHIAVSDDIVDPRKGTQSK